MNFHGKVLFSVCRFVFQEKSWNRTTLLGDEDWRCFPAHGQTTDTTLQLIQSETKIILHNKCTRLTKIYEELNYNIYSVLSLHLREIEREKDSLQSSRVQHLNVVVICIFLCEQSIQSLCFMTEIWQTPSMLCDEHHSMWIPKYLRALFVYNNNNPSMSHFHFTYWIECMKCVCARARCILFLLAQKICEMREKIESERRFLTMT